MNITIRQLKVFLQVSNQQSFTQAAKYLHLTQPAISMQIKQLEEVVGHQLISKHGRKIQLTDAGEEILQLSRNILQDIEDSKNHLEQIVSGQQGKLKLAVATTVASVATKLLASFNEIYPDMRINFDVTNRENLIKQLQDNKADIVLMGQPPEQLQLISTKFMENPLVIISSPNHPLACQTRPATIKQLLEHGFILREPGSGTRMALERMFASKELNLESTMEMNSNDAIKQSVAAGLGLAVVSIHTLGNEIHDHKLAIVEAEGFPLQRSWYLVQNIGKRLSPLAEKFKDYIINEGRKMAKNLD